MLSLSLSLLTRQKSAKIGMGITIDAQSDDVVQQQQELASQPMMVSPPV